MSYLALVLILVVVLDTIHLRSRARRLRVLPSTTGGETQPGIVISVEDVAIDPGVAEAATAYAAARKVEMVDLVPADLPVFDALEIVRHHDSLARVPAGNRQPPSARHAFLVTPEVAARAGVGSGVFLDTASLIGMADRIGRFATAGGLAVSDGLRARRRESAASRRRAAEATYGLVAMPFLFTARFYLLLLLGAPIASPSSRWLGLVALALYHLQPACVFLGTPLRPRDLLMVTLFRHPLEVWRWISVVTAGGGGKDLDPWERARDDYATLLERGTTSFFEPRRESCPLCGGTALRVRLRTGDLFQRKPGRFVLERCGDCGHVFQNPRLSADGLSFYYRDFYGGLLGATLRDQFDHQTSRYVARAEMMRGLHEPRRWLDVGGGEGHFCATGGTVWPEARFELLDQNEAIGDAVRRGWVDAAHHGQFPALAPTLANRFDVVSMSHYLEHTVDPAAEIAAAGIVLQDEGVLLIEVPDPDCPLALLLGRFWYPWFQPQHLHFVSVPNLDRVLRENGFIPLLWHRREAHIPSDFTGAAIIIIGDLGGVPVNFPWRRPVGAVWSRWVPVWILGFLPLLLAVFAEWALGPLVGPLRLSNAYRVLARKQGSTFIRKDEEVGVRNGASS
jgi:hypothetical protein